MKSELFAALIEAQKEFPAIPRGRTARVPTKSGGSYSYNYADLGDVVSAVTPILHKHGLCIYQAGEVIGGKQALNTVLKHTESAIFIHSIFLLPETDDPQDMGASITYFRRYALCALLGIVTEEDTDGQLKPRDVAKPLQSPQEETLPSFPAPLPKQEGPQIISDPQLKRLFAIQKKSGMPDTALRALATTMGIASRSAIPKEKYASLCHLVENWKP